MKLKRKSLIIILGLAIITIAITTTILVLTSQRKFSVAYYGISQKTADIINEQIESVLKENKSKLNVLYYNTEKSVANLLKEKPYPDLLFITSGVAAENAVSIAEKKGCTISSAFFNNLCTSTYEASIAMNKNSEQKPVALPLLLDHYELAYNNNPKTNHLLFAGGEDSTLLAFVGCMLESIHGTQKAQEITNQLRSAKITEIPEIRKIAALIADGIKSKKISPYALNAKSKDLPLIIADEEPAIIFMTLTQHRTIPLRTIQKYEVKPFPSMNQKTIESVTSPIIYAIPQKTSKNSTKINNLIFEHLTNDYVQYVLSSKTGLAPTHKQAETEDIQAADLRFWVAATKPLPALSDAVFQTTPLRQNACKDFRDLILEYVNSNTP